MGTIHNAATERAQRVIAHRNVVVHLLADCNVTGVVTTGTEDLAIVTFDTRDNADLFATFVSECTTNYRTVRSGDMFNRLYVYRTGSFYRAHIEHNAFVRR